MKDLTRVLLSYFTKMNYNLVFNQVEWGLIRYIYPTKEFFVHKDYGHPFKRNKGVPLLKIYDKKE